VEKRFVTVGGDTLCYVEEGQGPPLVLVHGFLVSHVVWKPVMAKLAPKYRVIALDLPGHGDSARPSPSVFRYDAHAFADRVVGFLDALKVERAALVGHSMGGKVVSYVAAKYPDRVNRLVLVDAQALPHPLPFLGRLIQTPVLGKLLFVHGYRRFAVKLYFQNDVFTRPDMVKDDMVDEVYRCLDLPGGREALYAAMSNTVGKDAEVPGILDRIKVPVKLVWGDRDRIFPLERAQALQRVLPGSVLSVVEGCGHTPVEEHPDRVAQEIESFVGAVA
jgi:pimeloyl-ACP methyl ester carboxylesterase